MALFTPLLDQWINHPIARAEANYQQRVRPQNATKGSRRLRQSVFILILGASIFLTLIAPSLIGYSWFFNAPRSLLELVLGRLQSLTALMLLFLVMANYIGVFSATMQTAAAAIVREKRAHTWESLILTNVNARDMIRGKWWGVLQTVWIAYRARLITRTAILFWLILSAGLGGLIRADVSLPTITLPVALITLLIAVVFPVVNVCWIAAVGILGSLFGRDEVTSRGAAAVILIGLLLGVSVIIMFGFVIDGGSGWVTTLFPLWASIIDGGAMMLFVLSDTTLIADALPMLVWALVHLSIMALLTGGLLRSAEWVAVRQRVSARPG